MKDIAHIIQWYKPNLSCKQYSLLKFCIGKFEYPKKDDVLMFYNAYAPPTSFDIDENENAIDTKITTNKLVYGQGIPIF